MEKFIILITGGKTEFYGICHMCLNFINYSCTIMMRRNLLKQNWNFFSLFLFNVIKSRLARYKFNSYNPVLNSFCFCYFYDVYISSFFNMCSAASLYIKIFNGYNSN